MFGGVFFVSKSLLVIERQRKLKKIAILTRKPWIDARILIYHTWPIGCGFAGGFLACPELCSDWFSTKLTFWNQIQMLTVF